MIQVVALILVSFLNKKYWNWKLKNYQIALILASILYFSFLFISIINIYDFSHQVDAFDLNNDRIFSIEEKIPEQQKALKNLQKAYEGKNKVAILGTFIAVIYFMIIVIPMKILNKKK